MKYRLIIDKNAEEEIVLTVHAPSSLTEQIENLVRSYSGADGITAYGDDEMRRLTFEEIECITVIDRRVMAIDANGKRVVVRAFDDKARALRRNFEALRVVFRCVLKYY